MSILEEKKVIFETVEYLKTPLSKSDIKSLSLKLKLRPKDFIRKNDLAKLDLKPDLENDDEMVSLIENNPKIMERPIIVKGKNAVIGRPPENVLTLL